MKVSQAKFFTVVFLSSIDVIIPESVLISRLISQPKDQQTWKKVYDSFVVPSSACFQGRIGTGSNYCNESCTEYDSKEQYSCDCPPKYATVTYVNNTWACLENKMVRKKLGCANNSLFHFEKEWHELYTLSTQRRYGRKTALNKKEASCVLNTSSSWVIGCQGEKTPIDKLTNSTNRTKEIFVFGWNSKSNAYYIKSFKPVLPDVSYSVNVVEPIAILRGRIINLGVSCSQPPPDIKEGCLLFKLEGNVTCPFEYSMGSTLSPATSSLELTASSTTKITEETIYPTQSKVTEETIYPTQISSRANPGKKKKSNDVDSSFITVGIIAGVIVAVLLLSLLITALFIYRRRKSRNAACSITNGQVVSENTTACDSKTNQAFQLEERSRYVSNDSSVIDDKKTGPLPQGNSGTLTSDNPLYFAVEDLTEIQEPVGNAPNQSEPVYNEVDENNAIDADRASWYGSVPVGDPFYNTLEGPYQYVASPPTNDVYNVLERSSQSFTGGGDVYSQLTAKDPVYNVLEGPDPCNDNEGSLYSNSIEVRYSNSPTNAPIYAVANEKG